MSKASGSKFSGVDAAMAKFTAKAEQRLRLAPAKPFPEEEMSKSKSKGRLSRAITDFWYFDKTYFPEEIHSFYAPPNIMHRYMLDEIHASGVSLILGPRMHAKTSYAKKMVAWKLLCSSIRVAGTYSETLPKSQNLMADIAEIIADNPRIQHDFNVVVTERNYDQFEFHREGNYRTLASFSEGRSLRGFVSRFTRPQLLLADDVETLQSSFSSEHVDTRIRRIAEARASLEQSGVVLWLGNNFNVKSATNKLLQLQEKGLLPAGWRVAVFKAWEQGKPLWQEAFNCESEIELRQHLDALDEADWQGNYQQNPIPPEGTLFRRDNYKEWQVLPSDVKCAIYCDPNLSLKEQGDTTAVVLGGYSPSTDAFYVVDAVCRSFSSPSELLDAVFTMREQWRHLAIYGIAWDGHVSQEATWTNFVRNYQRERNIAVPRVEYKRYHTDALAKNTQLIYADGKVFFPPQFNTTEQGEMFLRQFFSFSGKGKKNTDDAPDALICLVEYLHERKVVKRKSADAHKATIFSLFSKKF